MISSDSEVEEEEEPVIPSGFPSNLLMIGYHSPDISAKHPVQGKSPRVNLLDDVSVANIAESNTIADTVKRKRRLLDSPVGSIIPDSPEQNLPEAVANQWDSRLERTRAGTVETLDQIAAIGDELTVAEFSCSSPGCHASYRSPELLEEHFGSVHKNKKFKCQKCSRSSKGYTHGHNFVNHLRSVHNSSPVKANLEFYYQREELGYGTTESLLKAVGMDVLQ